MHCQPKFLTWTVNNLINNYIKSHACSEKEKEKKANYS